MSWQDFVTISPFVAGVLTAAAILIVDLIRPGRAEIAVGTALIGLAITALLTIAVGATPATAFDGAYKVDDEDRSRCLDARHQRADRDEVLPAQWATPVSGSSEPRLCRIST